MGSEMAIVVDPVGVVIAALGLALFACGIAMRPQDHSSFARSGQDALSGLFKGSTLKAHVRKASRSAQRRDKLEGFAKAMRGAEADPEIIRDIARELRGEGFILLDARGIPVPEGSPAEVISITEFEELKLLPPPAQAA